MEISTLQFPLEANVQALAHFMNVDETYAFTFASPFCYDEPAELRVKKVFLLAKFSHLKKNAMTAEEIYSGFTYGEGKRPLEHGKLKAAIKDVQLYGPDMQPIGTLEALVQKGFLRSYNGDGTNPIFDRDHKLVGFAYYNAEDHAKEVYTCGEDFPHLYEAVKPKEMRAYEAQGLVRRVFSYDIHEVEGTKSKDRWAAIFSAQKKSELTNNRLNRFGALLDEDTMLLLLTGLVGYFWATYIDVPL